MRISEVSIHRPVFATVMSLVVVLIGLVGYTRLSVREYPNIDPPVVTVTTTYTGASAPIVETQVTKVLEDSLSGIEGIDYITSISRQEQSQITIRFKLERDADSAAADVRDRVGRTRGHLPEEIDEPIIQKIEADAQPILYVAFYSDKHSALEITDYADRYLPEVLARFSRSNPRVEVTVVCEPTPMLVDAIMQQQLDLAIVTQCETTVPAEIFREERLLWVASARHSVHEEEVVPLALGRAVCSWRRSATGALDSTGRRYRVLYSSWNSNAVGAAVMAGLAVSVLPESAVRTGMRVLTPADGFPNLPSCKVGLMRASANGDALVAALAGHVIQGLENLPSRVEAPVREAAE